MSGRIGAVYDYTGPAGQPRIRKVRRDPKQFSMQSWVVCENGKGRWRYGIRDDRVAWSCRALYRLPEVIAALKLGEPVYLAEGEKDADSLCSLGVVATSHWQGADDFYYQQALWLSGSSKSPVTIVCDNDLAGAFSGWLRYTTLLRADVDLSRLRVVAPPFYGGRWLKDAADAVEAGLGLCDFRRVRLARLEKAAQRYRPRRGRYGYPTPGSKG